MSKSYKILVPKPATANKDGTDVRLYMADEVVEAKEKWQTEVMSTFCLLYTSPSPRDRG